MCLCEDVCVSEHMCVRACVCARVWLRGSEEKVCVCFTTSMTNDPSYLERRR